MISEKESHLRRLKFKEKANTRQLQKLAKHICVCCPGEIHNEGAIETAMNIISKYIRIKKYVRKI